MRTQLDTTQRKNKSKQSTEIRSKHYAKSTHEYQMTINLKEPEAAEVPSQK
jgi:hypothetical protein